jgi:hypothetical protein
MRLFKPRDYFEECCIPVQGRGREYEVLFELTYLLIKPCHLDIKNNLLSSCAGLSTGVEKIPEQITLAALRTYRKSEVRFLPNLKSSSLIPFYRSSSLLLYRRNSIVIAMELAAAPQIISCQPLFAC